MTAPKPIRSPRITFTTLALLLAATGCDKFASDEQRADANITNTITTSLEHKAKADTQSVQAAVTSLNKAAAEPGASLTAKIKARSLLAQTEFEQGEKTVRDLSAVTPLINRSLWSIAQRAAQIDLLSADVKASAAKDPTPTLATITATRQTQSTAAEAASAKAAELQAAIDKIKADIATATTQKDALQTQSAATSSKAVNAAPAEVNDLQTKAAQAGFDAERLSHKLDLLTASLLPLERDLALENIKKASAADAVTALDATKTSTDTSWKSAQDQMSQRTALAKKLGDEITAEAASIDKLLKDADTLRAQAVDQFTRSAGHYANAADDAKKLATEIGNWQTNARTAPENKAWEGLKAVYSINTFKLEEAHAHAALGNLYTNQYIQLAARARLATSMAPAVTAAGISLPPSLVASIDAAVTTAKTAADKEYADAADKFAAVAEGSAKAPELATAARLARIFSLYGLYLTGDKAKLADAKKIVTESLSEPKYEALLKLLPADIRG